MGQLKKLQKGAYKAIANAETQRITNDRLLEVAKEEKKRGKRKKGKNCGFGRVMGIEVIEQREEEARERAFLKAWKEDFSKIDTNIFIAPKKAIKASSPTKRASPTKRKALELIELGPKKKLRIECNGTAEIEAPVTQTRVGRRVKRTLKARIRA